MKFIAIADTHGLHRTLKLPAADVLIHAGDVCNFGDEVEFQDFLAWYDSLNYPYKILIGGNHDYLMDYHPQQFQEMLPKSIHYLQDSGITINGIKLWGSPFVPDLEGMAFGKRRGRAMRAHWNLIPDDTDILITHTPPYGVLDESGRNRSFGCGELTDRLQHIAPSFHIFGHIHSSYGQTSQAHTTYINAANMDGKQGLIHPPTIFEYEK